MSARVDYADGRQRTLKNLRWLHEHARDAEIVRITEKPRDNGEESAAEVVVYGRGWAYTTRFESFRIALDWLKKSRRLSHTQHEIQYATVEAAPVASFADGTEEHPW